MEIENSLVKHFMSTPVFFIKADFVLEQAIKVFQENNIVLAPVIVDKTKVLGALNDFQLVKLFLMRTANPAKARIQDFTEEFEPVVLIDQEETIETAFKLMIQAPSHRIYVTNQNKLVGKLSPRDILPLLAGGNSAERYKESGDLTTARIRIKDLTAQLAQSQSDLNSFRTMFDGSPYMIYTSNLSGEITMANVMIHLILGYGEGELIGKTIFDIYAQQFHQQVEETQLRATTNVRNHFCHSLMVKKNKDLIPADVITAAKQNDLGKVIETVTVSRISDTEKMLKVLNVVF